MDEFISTFHIDWKLMLAQAFNFGLVFLALYYLASKPLKKVIEERTNEIKTGLMDAKINKEVLEKTKEEYEEITRTARAEAHTIFESSKKEAMDKKNEMLEGAKIEVNTIIENGKKVLEAEKAKMLAEAKKEIVSLVLQTTEKLIGEEVPPSFNNKVVKELNSI